MLQRIVRAGRAIGGITEIHRHKNVRLTGDTRFDRVKQIAENAKQIVKVEQFCDGRPAIVCGSTWPPDEEILLEYINCHPDGYKWIIVSRNRGKSHQSDFGQMQEEGSPLHLGKY